MPVTPNNRYLRHFLITFIMLMSFILSCGVGFAFEKIAILDFSIDTGQTANQWIPKAINLDLSDNMALLHNFEVVSFKDKELSLAKFSSSQQQDPAFIGNLLGATKVVSGELIEEKNSIILYGQIHDLNKKKHPIKFTVTGRTRWLSDFSENIAWQIIDKLNLRDFSPEDEDRLRFKVKNNERLRDFLRAELAYVNAEDEKALNLYRALQKAEPGLITSYLRMVDILIKKAKLANNISDRNTLYNETHALLRKANKTDPRHRKVYLYLGRLFSQKSWIGRDDEAAINYLRQAISFFAHDTEAYRELAYLYADNLRQYEKAIGVLEEVLDYEPNNSDIEHDISNIYKLSQGQKFIIR